MHYLASWGCRSDRVQAVWNLCFCILSFGKLKIYNIFERSAIFDTCSLESEQRPGFIYLRCLILSCSVFAISFLFLLCGFFSLTVGEFYILNKQTYIPHILWMLVLNLNIFPHSEMSYASLFLFFFHLVNYGILSSDFSPSRLNITLADDRCFNSVTPMGSVTWGAASAHVAPSLSTEKETTSIYYWIEPDLNLFADK